MSYYDFQKQVGLSCQLKMNLPGIAHLLVSVPPASADHSGTEAYIQTIRALIHRGGDGASRGNVLGGLVGLQVGASHLPKEWTDKTTQFARAKELVDKLSAAL